jgi:hypothetical protein
VAARVKVHRIRKKLLAIRVEWEDCQGQKSHGTSYSTCCPCTWPVK